MEIEQIKKNALEDKIPIIMDETLEKIQEEVKGKNIKSILEIGTAVGYSALKFKEFIAEDGIIDTIERDKVRIEKARINIDANSHIRSDVNINIYEGDAISILEKILLEQKSYDMIFIDAAKSKYPIFLNYSLKLLKKDGIIFADNVLFKGYVLSDYNEHKHRTAVNSLRRFLKDIKTDSKLESEVLDIGDGLAIIRKR